MNNSLTILSIPQFGVLRLMSDGSSRQEKSEFEHLEISITFFLVSMEINLMGKHS